MITTTIFVLWLSMATTKGYNWGPSEASTLPTCQRAAVAAMKEVGAHNLPPDKWRCVAYHR